MSGVKSVRLLDSGSLVIDQSHITWNVGAGNPVRFPVYSVLIEHTDGLFMFDSGYDLDLVNAVLPFELPEQTAEQTVPGQLAKCGYAPEDVDAIINSHLHFDHVGGNRHLTKATTYVHRDEVRQARSPEPFEHFGYADRGWDHAGATFSLIEGDFEFAPGLHLFHTPGHTVGHYSLLIEHDGRRPLLAMADVSYTPAAFERDQQAGFHNNPVDGVRSIRRCKRLAKEYGADILFSHDMATFEGYALAPDPFSFTGGGA
jgi:4-pyridoxolactonase